MSGPPDFIIKKNRTANGQPFFKKRGYTSDMNQEGFRPHRTGQVNSQKQIVKKETVYEGEHDLGSGPYAVEILFTMKE